jgi:serine/threonine protein kinase
LAGISSSSPDIEQLQLHSTDVDIHLAQQHPRGQKITTMSDFKLEDYTYVRKFNDGPFEGVELWKRRKGRITEIPSVRLQRYNTRDPLGSDVVQRFVDEAQKDCELIQHENVVKFICQVEHNGDPCLVFEYVPETLYNIVTSPEKRTRLTPAFKARITRQLVSVLQHLHSIGKVRADIKLEHMLITTDGVMKLSRFLKQKKLDPARNLYWDGGCLRYRAPEMILEDPACDWRADIWAIGCVAYELSVFEQAFDISSENWPWWDVLWSQVQGVGRLCQQHVHVLRRRFTQEARGQRQPTGTVLRAARAARVLLADPAPGYLEERMLSKGLDEEFKRFITSCLQMRPHDQPTCQELLQERFLTRHNET